MWPPQKTITDCWSNQEHYENKEIALVAAGLSPVEKAEHG
ncbi:msr4734 [Mesorhizobium japonicum MAFF 303099]|uniref:Msr4734 protein n=1 Tax=Mesorhizobium japonicum (strain LMG 29417 / CECT 9101 / MAFF 303099) TaxID=266835 RepID=Q98DE9_RHILO|nr:msr4734 [Mesorhizobium japonicum MAFF 303099]